MRNLRAVNHKRTGKWSKQALLLYYGLTDPGTPFYARLPALLALVYLISPIDLIPDFIPFAGWLDDLVVVPVLLALSIRLFPREVREASRIKAEKGARKARIVIGIFLVAVGLLLIGIIFLGAKLFSHLMK
ncbi:MAG: DUF1232 domain-containing protein [Puia sp.]|nr:DUF1232 domain-containing protein [Puia sp.]